MKHVWKVEFETKYSGIGDYMSDEVFRVVANGDGRKAVRLAEKLALKASFWDDGVLRKAQKVRLVALSQISELSE